MAEPSGIPAEWYPPVLADAVTEVGRDTDERPPMTEHARRPTASSIRTGYDRWASVYDSDANPLPALEEPVVRGGRGRARFDDTRLGMWDREVGDLVGSLERDRHGRRLLRGDAGQSPREARRREHSIPGS